MTDTLHVVPCGDAVEHDTSTADADCVCGPRVELASRGDGSDGWIVVHSSLDGREVNR